MSRLEHCEQLNQLNLAAFLAKVPDPMQDFTIARASRWNEVMDHPREKKQQRGLIA